MVYNDNFSNLTGLKKLTIGKNVENIRKDNFSGCTNLTEIHALSKEPPYCYPNVLTNAPTSTATLYVPQGSRQKYAEADTWKDFTNIVGVDDVLATSINLDKEKCSINIGDTQTLIATILPENATYKDVAWLSSDTTIAKVSSFGVITGIAVGKATITATTTDGTELSASCVVKVYNGATIGKISVTENDGTQREIDCVDGDDLSVNDDIKAISNNNVIDNINLTYTRNFANANVWQAWYTPFEIDYDDMATQLDVAQIQGILLNEAGNPVVAFLKMNEGTIKANTPYVVKPKTSGDIILSAKVTVKPTTEAKTFSIQSAVNNFTFGGVYEKTLNGSNGWYAINTSGSFQAMGTDVYLRPFRIYMTIADRDDNPYASTTPASGKVEIVVIGDDATGIEESLSPAFSSSKGDVYDLNGMRVNESYKGIVIKDGRKYFRK